MPSGQMGHLSYLSPGSTGPLCSPFLVDKLPSPGFLASPTSLLQFLAGRSVCMMVAAAALPLSLSFSLSVSLCVLCVGSD